MLLKKGYIQHCGLVLPTLPNIDVMSTILVTTSYDINYYFREIFFQTFKIQNIILMHKDFFLIIKGNIRCCIALNFLINQILLELLCRITIDRVHKIIHNVN